MAPVYEPKTRDTLRRYSQLPRERREYRRRSSLEEYRSGAGIELSIPPDEGDAWWEYATSKFAKGEMHLAEQRALSRASGAAGNFLVPTDLADAIIGAARAESAVARLARTFTTDSGSTLTLPTAPTHGTGAWTAENAATTPSDEVFGEVPLAAHKATTKVVVSEELARDARVQFDTYLADEVGRRLGVLQGVAFATGSGTGQAQGIVPNVTAVTAATGSSTSFKLTDIVAAFKALPAPYRPRSVWVLHPDTFANLASLTDTAGVLILPALQSETPSLLGRPVEVDANMPVPAASARSAILADFQSAYAIRRVDGVSVQRLEELHSDAGQLGYRAVARADGRVVLSDAARALSHSAT